MPKQEKRKIFLHSFLKSEGLELRNLDISISIQITMVGASHLSIFQQQRLAAALHRSLKSLFGLRRLAWHFIPLANMADSRKIFDQCSYQIKAISSYQPTHLRQKQE